MTDCFAFAISSEIDSLLLQQLMQHLQESNEEGYDPQSLFTFFIGYFFPKKRSCQVQAIVINQQNRNKELIETQETILLSDLDLE